MGIERRTERELRRTLDDMLNTLFPQGYGEFVNPQIEQARIHQAFLADQHLRDTISRAIQDSADLGVSVAVRQFENVGFGFDYTLANETARAWALRYTDEVLAQLGTTTARIVGQSVGRWIGNGEPLQALVNDLRPAFGKQRARLIASTEVTRAYAQGTKEAYTASGVVKKLVWQASMDERVCFPAWTTVRTEAGNMPIQDITPGMRVLTRNGLRTVIASGRRKYVGPMTKISTSMGTVVATSDHPFWTLEQGWLQCGQINTGHTLETFDNQSVKPVRVFNFNVGDSADLPAMQSQVASLLGVPPSVLMPVDAINLKGDPIFGQQKVNAVAAYFSLLNVDYAQEIERLSNTLFRHILALKTAIAGKTTKLPPDAWGVPELLLAMAACFNKRRPPALLRAVMPIQSLFRPEELSAPLTGDVLCRGSSALSAAKCISFRYRRSDTERLSATGADFLNRFSGIVNLVTSAATKTPTGGDLGLGKIGKFLANGAGNLFTLARKGVVALCGAERIGGGQFGRLGNFPTTLRASIEKRHDLRLLTNFLLLYHRLSGNAIWVYDIQVESDPEFYANGILVHNCMFCGSLHGKVVGIEESFDGALPANLRERARPFALPPAHPGCRCWVSAQIDEPKRERKPKVPKPQPAPVPKPSRTAVTIDSDAIALRRANMTEEKLAQLFDIGPSAKANIRIRDWGDRVEINGEWIDVATGENIGECIRELFPEQKKAYLTVLSFEPGYIGNGVGMKVARQWFDELGAAGYEKAELYAGLTVGRYAWAKEGAIYADPGQAARSTQLFREWASQKNINLSEGEYPTFTSVLDVATYSHPRGATLTGKDITNRDVPPDMALPLGKAFMLDISFNGHGGWNGIIDLEERRRAAQSKSVKGMGAKAGNVFAYINGNNDAQSDALFFAAYLVDDDASVTPLLGGANAG